MSTTEKEILSAENALKQSKKFAAATVEYKNIAAMIENAIQAGETEIFKDRATLSSGIVECLKERGYKVDDGSDGYGYKVSWASSGEADNSEEE